MLQGKPAPKSPKANLKPVPSEPAPAPKKTAAAKAPSKPPAKKTTGRRAGATALRSTN
jgi:hypothetical protein